MQNLSPRSLVHTGPSAEAGNRTPAVLRKGFRPFFLAAAAFAMAMVPVWVASFVWGGTPSPYFAPMYWHAHEMLFGFVQAVLAGFLLTATSNWTGRETLVGYRLGLVTLVWLLPRLLWLLPLSGPTWRGLATLVDLGFAPLIAVAIARPMLATRSFRNLGFALVWLGLFAANLLMHLGAWNLLPNGAVLGSRLGLNLTLLAIVVVSGRVVPMFTKNATRNPRIRSLPALDRASITLMLVVVSGDLLPMPTWLVPTVAVIAGALLLLRSWHWGFVASLRQPLLWILHLGHLWVPVGLWLKAASVWGGAWAFVWLHALTVGAIGMLTLGMMVRVTLGHTGRMLAPPRSAVLAFALVALAALTRVALPALFPAAYSQWLMVSGVLWSGAFLAFLVGCAPMLLTPRVDGRSG